MANTGKEAPAKPGDSNRTKRQEEVAEQQIANKLEGFTNIPDEPVTTFTAHSQSGKREKEIDIEVAGGVVFLNTHGPVRLEGAEVIGFEKRFARAAQATR
jgi:hypothetical protein